MKNLAEHFGKMKVSQALPLIKKAAEHWNRAYPQGQQLKLSRHRDWMIAWRIFKESERQRIKTLMKIITPSAGGSC